MGLREKVALVIAVIILKQVIYGTSSTHSKITKDDYRKQIENRSHDTATPLFTAENVYPNIHRPKRKSIPSDRGQEAIRKAFKFPDVEYPSAPIASLQFYSQDQNMQEVNPNQRNSNTSPTSPLFSDNTISKKYTSNKYKLAKLRALKNNRVTAPEFGTTPKPYCYREGLFPEVEYPLSIGDIWKSNFWSVTPNLEPEKNDNHLTKYSYRKIDKTSKTSKLIPGKKSVTAAKSETQEKTKDGTILPIQTDSIKYPKQHSISSDTLIAAKQGDEYLEGNNVCPKVCDQTSSTRNVTTKASYSSDVKYITPFKIQNDDNIPTVSSDNKTVSIYDELNKVVYESTDNKDLCFEDNFIDNTKSSAFNIDEEFTTDIPDFDENMFSMSTSTVSPISLVDVDEDWSNTVVTDSNGPEAESDELEQYFIVVP